MAKLTGANSYAALKLNAAAVAWNTAGSVGSGDLCPAKYTPNNGGSELNSSSIGTGRQMLDDSQLGNDEYGFTLEGEATYQSGLDRVLGQFFGTSGSPTEVTASQGDYKHTMTFNSTWNSNYCTYAVESASATVHEYPSAAFRSLTISSQSPKAYLNWVAEAVASDLILTSWTNDNSAIRSATQADDEKILVSQDDDFWINAQAGGSLSSGDAVAITDYQIQLSKPQTSPSEIKGSSGNSAPNADGLIEGTITITLSSQADNTYFTAWKAGTEYKSLFKVEGTTIASGTPKSITIYVPRMKLITQPDYSVTEDGVNPLTLTFKILAASANPTGMSNTLPYVELVNEKSSAYIS